METIMYALPLMSVVGVLAVSYPKAVMWFVAGYVALLVLKGQYGRRPRC
jgi:hypothetical protein